MRKTLKTILLSALLGLNGCSYARDTIYHLEGQLGEEYFVLHEWPNSMNLKIKREDGTIVTFEDSNKDRKLDHLSIKNKSKRLYRHYSMTDHLDRKILEDISAQSMFEEYLQIILQPRKEEASELLKK